MVAFIGWHEWSTRVLSAKQEMIWRKCRQVFRVVTYCCQVSCVVFALHFILWYWVPRRWGFSCPRLQSLLSWNFELVPKWSSRRIEFPVNSLWVKSLSTLALSDSFMNALSSLAAPTKFFPLLLMMVFGYPCIAMNLVIEARHDSVFTDCSTAICTALVVRQVKRQHHHFKVRRGDLNSKGPGYTTPIWVNGFIKPFSA